MPTKTSKKPIKNKSKTAKRISTNANPNGVRPSFGIIVTLVIALIIAIVVGVVSFNKLKSVDNELAASKLKVFNHLAESYVREMEFTSNDKPTTRQMTGYGISDEDGAFYITFDFIPYDRVYDLPGVSYMPDGETRHAIMYFWEDKDNNTYSHAFSYHDDASYHPDGTYVKIEPREELKDYVQQRQ